MEKSVFDEIKEDICNNLKKAKTLTELSDRLQRILEEYDFEEEQDA